MSHTPGPWKLVRYGNGSIVVAKNATPLDRWDTVSDIVARTDWGRGREDEYNARLIAAAPDLLIACQAALNDRMFKDWPEIATLLMAAIAKAEGR